MLGDDSICDVYVLSFKKPCSSASVPSHFKYILDQTATTWSLGRNAVFKYVNSLNLRYKYHIFFDDDVHLIYTEAMIKFAQDKSITEGTPHLYHTF